MTRPVPTVDLFLDAVSAYRLTKLVTDDDITAPIRNRVINWAYRRSHSVSLTEYQDKLNRMDPDVGEDWSAIAIDDPDPPKLATLAVCRWCISVWFGFGIVAARRLFPRWWPEAARALTYAAAAALIAGLEE